MSLNDLILFLYFYLENFANIFLNHTELDYSGVDVFEMRGKERMPKYKQDLENFGKDIERKHQGQIFEEKIKQIPENLAKQHLFREELTMSYTPEANPHEFIETMKEKIGTNTSPGTNTERSMYNSIKYKNTINQNHINFSQYVKYHWENSLRNIIKGTPDQGVDDLFGATPQDFIETYKTNKNSPRSK